MLIYPVGMAIVLTVVAVHSIATCCVMRFRYGFGEGKSDRRSSVAWRSVSRDQWRLGPHADAQVGAVASDAEQRATHVGIAPTT